MSLSIYLLRAVRAVLIGRTTRLGFHCAWFSSLSSKHLCIFGIRGAVYYTIQLKNLDHALFYLSAIEPGGIS